MDVNPAKSPRSTIATDAPCAARAAADEAPLIPPPTISTSKMPPSSFEILVSRIATAAPAIGRSYWLRRTEFIVSELALSLPDVRGICALSN
jgi:hypothetical protein